MTTKYVTYCTTSKPDCAFVPNAPVIICLEDDALVVQPDPPHDIPISYIEATICAAASYQQGCQNFTYQYTFAYDDEQIADPDRGLLSADITGFLCEDCLTDFILEQATAAGAGSVTTVSVVPANGFSGSVATPSTTPAITLTLDDDAVTFAKIQNVTSARLLGRATAGSGIIEEITLGTGLSFAGTTLNATGSGSGITDLTGDVTATGPGSAVATIANDAVTFAKFQNITTARLLGRATAGTGNTEELSLGTGLGFSGTSLILTFPAGSLIYSADPFLIAADTADAADAKGIDINGGGATGVTRGAFLTLRGNEDAALGNAVLSAGSTATGNVQIQALGAGGYVNLAAGGNSGAVKLDASGNFLFTPASSGNTVIYRSINAASMILSGGTGSNRTTGGVVNLQSAAAGNDVVIDTGATAGGTAKLQLRNADVLETDTATDAIGFYTSLNDRPRWIILGNGDLVYSNTGATTPENFIRSNGADGSDSKRISVCGGGGGVSGGTSRGATVRASGNEHVTTPGQLLLQSGNVATAGITVDVGLSTGSLISSFASTTAATLTNAQETLTFDTINKVELNKKVQTTDNTTSNLWAFTLADNTSYRMEAQITARLSSTTAKGLMGRIGFGVYRNNAGGATLVEAGGDVETVITTYGSSGYTADVDVSGNDVRIRVTGANAETVNWAVNMQYVLTS